VLTCQPSTVWCSRERLPAAAAQPAQGSSEPVTPRIYLYYYRIQGWTEMAQDRVRRQSLVKERLNLRAMLMQCRLINVVERRLVALLRVWGL
jgi:hypothetical protein